MRATYRNAVIGVLAAGEFAAAAAAWRDLNHRPDDAVRGPKRAWRIAVLINPGNALAYWAIGRR